ncbi:MAG TPA: hypothetical protein VH437_16085 [Terriglobales bacterium]|jgi:hypothetical protein
MNRVSRSLQIVLPIALAVCVSAQTQPAPTPATNPPAAQTAAPDKPAAKPPYDPLLDFPPLPHDRVTLIGGTVTKLDQVQDKMTIQPFGSGKKMHVAFDVRTNFLRNGASAKQHDLRAGDRVYLDTMLNGTQVFAKTIWIQAASPTGEGEGQVVDYDGETQLLTVRDELSQQALRFKLTPSTVVKIGDQTRLVTDLKPGTLVSLTFGPQQDRYGTVREISVLALPGMSFSFFGRITFLDLSARIIAIDNNNDGKNYTIHFEGLPQGTLRGLRQGNEVGISAVFDGSQYVARSVQPAAPKPSPDEDKEEK